MHRARNKITALAASMVALAVIGSGPPVADPFATGPLVPVSGASPIAACEGDTGFRDCGGANGATRGTGAIAER
jgi:hypothetical protein